MLVHFKLNVVPSLSPSFSSSWSGGGAAWPEGTGSPTSASSEGSVAVAAAVVAAIAAAAAAAVVAAAELAARRPSPPPRRGIWGRPPW